MTDNDIILAIIFSTLIILLLIAGIAITIFISGKKEARLQLEYEKELRAAQQEVQEQTMINIARELHDNIGQLLTVVKMQLEIKAQQSPEFSHDISLIKNTVNDSIQQLRLLSRSLNSDMLEEYGLLQAIDQEITRLKTVAITVIHWQHDGTEPKLNKNQRLMSFRMFQEIINNSLKHAHAKNIYIHLKGDGKFALTIKDDGKGFDLERIMQQNGGMGLKNIIKRANLSDLTCKILASEGEGSIFTLELFSK